MIGTSGNTNLRSQFINLKNRLKKSESLTAEVDKWKKVGQLINIICIIMIIKYLF